MSSNIDMNTWINEGRVQRRQEVGDQLTESELLDLLRRRTGREYGVTSSNPNQPTSNVDAMTLGSTNRVH